MKQSFIVILCLFYFQQALFAQNYIKKTPPEITDLEQDDFKIHKKQGAYYNEQWAYHVILNNGAQIYVTYTVHHFAGLRNSSSSGRLSLLNWKGENYSTAKEYDLNNLVLDENPYKMKLHPERDIWIAGIPGFNEHHFHFKGKYEIQINFDQPYPGFKPGDGVFKVGNEDELGMFVHIPFSRVSGYIADNNDTVKVSGIGFMDHTYQTNLATRLFETSYKFNGRTESGFSGGHFLVPKHSPNDAIGYAYFYDGETLTLKDPEKITVNKRKEVSGTKIPVDITVNYEDGSNDTFYFSEVEEKVAMLDELSAFKKLIIKPFLGGEVLFYRGRAQTNKKEEVYFNLSLVD
ncbi:hypothetical protein [Gracilimonas sp.]|uniref:hypothetical protein n=1 Tax=Gracilimonas sp. TaxID=1974203 RepID=UPI0032EED9EC